MTPEMSGDLPDTQSHILVPEPDLPVLHLREPHQRGGAGKPARVVSMRYTFSSCAFTTVDFRGFDPSHLTGLFYTFSGCSHLTTIYADSTRALPSSGITGSQCFYSCSTSLVGGNGTVWASSKTGYTYFRIDTASSPGYITAMN